ncbi:chaplin family protein, partial [Dactylosporangium sp. NPDC051484]|uniref:chaplin family protein n=1 Tax=Dactylosporangium sp. NPDC051484 TaxID=3154942 RepID=UPI00344F7827
MKTWVRKSLNVGVLSAGFLLVSGGVAHASDWATGNNSGLLNGNQFDTTLQVPVNVCGNSIAVLGFADANCGGGASAVKAESATATKSATTKDWTSGNNAGVLNGNQLDTKLQAPINISGNAVSVLGLSNASSAGGATAGKGDITSGGRHRHNGGNGAYSAGANGRSGAEGVANRTEDWTSGYNAGVLNGNQLDTTLQAPINISGNAIALLGFAGASGRGGAWAVNGESASTTGSNHITGYNAGLLNGNQFNTTLQVPVNVCGNAIAILGFASANCGGGATAIEGTGSGHGKGHGHGRGNGGQDSGGYVPGTKANSTVKVSTAPAAHTKNVAKTTTTKSQKSIDLGAYAKRKKHHNGTGAVLPPAPNNGPGNGSNNGSCASGDWTTGYNSGLLNGNQLGTTVQVPINIGGKGGASAVTGGHGDWTTGFNSGVLNGNQLGTTVQVPINIGGNGGASAVKGEGGCGDWTTGFNSGVLNGNQLGTTVQVPINIGGNGGASAVKGEGGCGDWTTGFNS